MDLNKLKAQLTLEEGLRLKPYSDTVGKLTIGVGHNLTDNGISHDIAMAILDEDIKDILSQIEHQSFWLAVENDDVRSRAIVDLIFNMGLGGFLQFKNTIAALIKKDWATASLQLLSSKWATQVGVRANNIAFMIRNGADPQ